MSGRRAAVLHMTWPTLRAFLGLPEDVKLDGLSHDPLTDTVTLIIEGNVSLPYVPEGQVPPQTDVEYEGGRFKRFTV